MGEIDQIVFNHDMDGSGGATAMDEAGLQATPLYHGAAGASSAYTDRVMGERIGKKQGKVSKDQVSASGCPAPR